MNMHSYIGAPHLDFL